MKRFEFGAGVVVLSLLCYLIRSTSLILVPYPQVPQFVNYTKIFWFQSIIESEAFWSWDFQVFAALWARQSISVPHGLRLIQRLRHIVLCSSARGKPEKPLTNFGGFNEVRSYSSNLWNVDTCPTWSVRSSLVNICCIPSTWILAFMDSGTQFVHNTPSLTMT